MHPRSDVFCGELVPLLDDFGEGKFGRRVALRVFEKDPLLFTVSLFFSFVDWLLFLKDFVSLPPLSGVSATRLLSTLPMKSICSGSPQLAAINSMSTMFHRFRIATVVELVARNSNSITLEVVPPGLEGKERNKRE